MFDLVVEFLRSRAYSIPRLMVLTRVEYLLSNRALKLTFRLHLTLE